ncbi:unnamed protein product [Closterium sp. NIES-65]|nr:unnamed protein product [Closterium sp. NIES-65]
MSFNFPIIFSPFPVASIPSPCIALFSASPPFTSSSLLNTPFFPVPTSHQPSSNPFSVISLSACPAPLCSPANRVDSESTEKSSHEPSFNPFSVFRYLPSCLPCPSLLPPFQQQISIRTNSNCKCYHCYFRLLCFLFFLLLRFLLLFLPCTLPRHHPSFPPPHYPSPDIPSPAAASPASYLSAEEGFENPGGGESMRGPEGSGAGGIGFSLLPPVPEAERAAMPRLLRMTVQGLDYR